MLIHTEGTGESEGTGSGDRRVLGGGFLGRSGSPDLIPEWVGAPASDIQPSEKGFPRPSESLMYVPGGQ